MAEIYNAGTVAVVQGSKTLVLSDGVWTPFNVRKGDIISLPNGYTALVESVTNTTHLEMVLPYDGATASGLAYAIVHGSVEWGTNVEIHHAVVRLLESVENPLDILFGAGVPDNAIGENKQLYIRNNPGGAGHGDVYKKADDAWQPSGNMLGPKGDKGDKGDAGDMSGANNLSELTNAAVARSNIGAVAKAGDMMSGQLHVSTGALDEVARFEGTGDPYFSFYDTNVRQSYIQSSVSTGLVVAAENNNPIRFFAGGAERERITPGGQVLLPNQPRFMAHYTGPAKTTDGTLLFQSAETNVGSHYDATLARFNAPVGGDYLFFKNIFFTLPTAGAGYAFTYLMKNGNSQGGALHTPNPAGPTDLNYIAAHKTAIIPMAQGDYMELYLGGTNNSSGIYAGTYSSWGGFLLG